MASGAEAVVHRAHSPGSLAWCGSADERGKQWLGSVFDGCRERVPGEPETRRYARCRPMDCADRGHNKRGRGAENKAKLIIAVSVWKDKDGNEKPGFAHAFVANDASAETIGSILKRLGVPDDEITPLINAIRTDGWQSYKAVAKDFGFVLHRVILSDPKDSMKLLPWTHKLIANAKSVFQGPHRGISTKHLQRYLSEVCYRFNRRFWYRQSFHRLLLACVSTTTITRDELMAPMLGEQSQ